MAKALVPRVGLVLSLFVLLLAFVASPAAGARAVAGGPRRLLAEVPEGGAGVEVEGGKAGGEAEAQEGGKGGEHVEKILKAADVLDASTQSVNERAVDESIKEGEQTLGSHREKLREIRDSHDRAEHRRTPRNERDHSVKGRLRAARDTYKEHVHEHVVDVGDRISSGWNSAAAHVLRSAGPLTKQKHLQNKGTAAKATQGEGSADKPPSRVASKASALASVLLAVPPLALALPLLLLCRAYRPGFLSLQRLLQTLLGALSLWFLLMCMLEEVIGVDPMVSFQQHQGHAAYVKVQFLSIIGMAALALLLLLQLVSSRFRGTAFVQTLLYFITVGHYYEAVFQPAVHGETPEPVLGLPPGFPMYMSYGGAFMVMAFLSPGQAVAAIERVGGKSSTE